MLINVRFFNDEEEIAEAEFTSLDLPISYERHTVFENGVSQICLTKSEYV